MTGGQRSAWDVAVAIGLLLPGLAIGWGGVWLSSTGIGHGPGSGGLFEVMLLLGLVGLAVAGLHLAAAIPIWRGEYRGRLPGLIIGLLGMGVSAFVGFVELQSALNPANFPQPAPAAPGAPPLPPASAGSVGPELWPILVLASYLIVVIGLLMSGRQFRRTQT